MTISDIPLAQDPGELFDVVHADGTPAGIRKPRAAVHRDGDWHRSVHVWVAGGSNTGDPWLMFQRRSLAKDTWPGFLDATVGGHFRAGESLAETLRETEEEIGMTVALADLRWLGTRVCANEAQSGIVDRELQEVFVREDNRPLTAFRPDPAELAELVRIPLAGVVSLFAEEAASVEVERFAPGAETIESGLVTLQDFIPNVDRYFFRVALAIERVFAGDEHVAI